MTTRLYFYDQTNDDGPTVEFYVDAPPDDVRAVLAMMPASNCANVQEAMMWFIRICRAPIRLDGIPCESAEQWFDEFVNVGEDAIAWDPLKGEILPEPGPFEIGFGERL